MKDGRKVVLFAFEATGFGRYLLAIVAIFGNFLWWFSSKRPFIPSWFSLVKCCQVVFSTKTFLPKLASTRKVLFGKVRLGKAHFSLVVWQYATVQLPFCYEFTCLLFFCSSLVSHFKVIFEVNCLFLTCFSLVACSCKITWHQAGTDSLSNNTSFCNLNFAMREAAPPGKTKRCLTC